MQIDDSEIMHWSKVFDGFSHRGIWLCIKFWLRFFHISLKSVRVCLQRLTPNDSLHIFSGTCTISRTRKKCQLFYCVFCIVAGEVCFKTGFLFGCHCFCCLVQTPEREKRDKKIPSNGQIIKAKKLLQISFYISTFCIYVLSQCVCVCDVH